MDSGKLPCSPRVGKTTEKCEAWRTTQNHDGSDGVSLSLRPRQAAKALGIGERLLWSKTNAGEIPHLRIGRAIVYPVGMLRD